MPADTPRFYGVFSPCFTCIKETHGAVKICRALAARGVAMLRFDTTGIGQSEGAMRDTTFTMRVQDIISAANALTAAHEAPRLLIGHSISGPAAISASLQLPSIEVVATVGSPKEPQTMISKFKAANQLAIDGDTVTFDILGRPAVFSKVFLDDIETQDVAADTAALTTTLLSFHAPEDGIVAYANMDQIVARAVKAKYSEAVPLPAGATHLFEKHSEDADFVAEKLLQFL